MPKNAKPHSRSGDAQTVKRKRQGAEAATPKFQKRQTSMVEATRRKPDAPKRKRGGAKAQPDAEAPAEPRPQPTRRRGGEGPRAASVKATRKRLLRRLIVSGGNAQAEGTSRATADAVPRKRHVDGCLRPKLPGRGPRHLETRRGSGDVQAEDAQAPDAKASNAETAMIKGRGGGWLPNWATLLLWLVRLRFPVRTSS
jgi:hypothetical protein